DTHPQPAGGRLARHRGDRCVPARLLLRHRDQLRGGRQHRADRGRRSPQLRRRQPRGGLLRDRRPAAVGV
ncbi:MAG: hypothetical protein AVDCRST_MAG06-1622, partial [uncultured Nocardioides sp.]